MANKRTWNDMNMDMEHLHQVPIPLYCITGCWCFTAAHRSIRAQRQIAFSICTGVCCVCLYVYPSVHRHTFVLWICNESIRFNSLHTVWVFCFRYFSRLFLHLFFISPGHSWSAMAAWGFCAVQNIHKLIALMQVKRMKIAGGKDIIVVVCWCGKI